MSDEETSYNAKKKFTQEEDDLVKFLFEEAGVKDWKLIASTMPQNNHRTPKSCNDRYQNYLKSSLNHDAWTIEEDHLLFELIEKYGKKWAVISKLMVGKSQSSVKNRWYKHLIKKVDKSFVEMIAKKKGSESDKLELETHESIQEEISIEMNEKEDSKLENIFESDIDFLETYADKMMKN